MKIIELTLISAFMFIAAGCGCGGYSSKKSDSYYRNKQKQAERAEKRAERQRIAAELKRPHKAPSPEYLEKYTQAQEIHQRRKMEDLKMQMKAEEAANRYTGP